MFMEFEYVKIKKLLQHVRKRRLRDWKAQHFAAIFIVLKFHIAEPCEASGASPQTPMGELTALLHTP